MELLVVGLGSMGKRRARLIRGVEPSAALAGVDVPEETKILIGEVESVELSEEFAHEKLSPVLAMYHAKDFDEALDKAEKLVCFQSFEQPHRHFLALVIEADSGLGNLHGLARIGKLRIFRLGI